MASPAQSFYCFETLAASYRDEEPPSLAAIEASYWDYIQSEQTALTGDKPIPETDDNADAERLDQGKTQSGPLNLPSISQLRRDISSDSSSMTTLSTASSRSALSNSTTLTTPDAPPSPLPQYTSDESYPLFVTWNLISRHGHRSLRGCIGTFAAQKLSEGLKEYALTSAFDDERFSPIPSALLPHLSCALTLLSNFETCSDAMDWEIGKHGIRINFIYRNRRYGATYLPDVPVEQGWTKEETIESLMRKAGWDGGSSGSVARRILRGSGSTMLAANNLKPWEEVSNFKTTRYEGLRTTADYCHWQEWRKWVESDKNRLNALLS